MPGAGGVADIFDGVSAEVPTALAEHLRRVRLIDHHVHGTFDRPIDRAGFEASINEASTDPIPGFMTQFDSPLGLSIRRWCAPVLGLPAHADADAYWKRRSQFTPDELAALMLPLAGVERWIVDTGFQGDLIAAPQRLTALSDRPSSKILRLEQLAQNLLESGTSPEAFPDAFRSALSDAVTSPETVGTKTIAAYRTSFDIDWSRPADHLVIEHARALAARDSQRADSPVLIAFGVHEAADLGLPLQVHVGFGDRDLDLHRTDPMLLLPLLRTMAPVPVLLLHCYPFHRQAGYLAQAFDNVNFDVGLGINHLGTRSTGLVAEALETAPFTKQLYSSDAFGPPELHLLGSVLWRRAMGLVLGGWVRAGDCSESDAIRIVDLIGVRNAERVYSL
ncbi:MULTISPECIES: amidohydrolase family protein [unclassified Mycolicibacterium]|uniref:amidohydrolase family protein n=1 Tax=unclassified Mycolicibacterium TaxID=2636767 RepID=UPI0012DEA48C|nr:MULTISPECIES: amidohydrolase family protein [unclassified Mycolicibacterium]MUL82636.1 amidohydrolase family protein [Mycolicibacterium sp. CBMA 329]MUL88971.1 amidohydrolase family protein [Mycolicibacterium sp. CBMA 331]MUL97538.1 amidohydrolase family protein [Mycolicibacterium sp. CBMA 334]MUM27209.1 amidohydrolase family protein [Mycolicibacterium sp. CBMA 295]MUM38487.1 amidohydrolase family protein [Mycolicibacterium sp. CBMA 247]